jgi:hypothetical protein
MAAMRSLLEFLRTHKLAWMLPILVALALLLVVAWQMSQTPENPFAYRDS